MADDMASVCRILAGVRAMVGKKHLIDEGQCDESPEMHVGNEPESGGLVSIGAASGAPDSDGNVHPLGRAEQAEIGRKLRDLYDGVAAEPLPKDVSDALAQLEQKLREIKND